MSVESTQLQIVFSVKQEESTQEGEAKYVIGLKSILLQGRFYCKV